jgi:hypothetical protein
MTAIITTITGLSWLQPIMNILTFLFSLPSPLVKFVVGVFFFMWVTWFLFLGIMTLMAARNAGKLTTLTYVLGYPWALFGAFMDFLVNMSIGTVLFLELPQEWLLTVRCDRLMTYGNPWRANLANWLCKNLLDPFQTGGHCHKIGQATVITTSTVNVPLTPKV